MTEKRIPQTKNLTKMKVKDDLIMKTQMKAASVVVDYKQMGTIIKGLRQENQYTQTTLGKKLNVTRSCVANWENGARIPDCNTVMKMASIFHVPMDYIYGTTDHKYSVNVPEYFELDGTKLNSEGMYMLYEYYKYLINSEKYSADEKNT